jgi:prefoldin subunit 5
MKYIILFSLLFFITSCWLQKNEEINNIVIEKNSTGWIIKELNSEIQSLNQNIYKLENSNKKIQKDIDILREENSNNKNDINVKWGYSWYGYDSTKINDIINIETKKNKIIIRLHDGIIVTYDMYQINSIYKENNSKILLNSVERRIKHFIKNHIQYTENILTIYHPFPEEWSLLNFLDIFYIDEENWYFYEITWEGISNYVTSYKDKHFIYTWWQTERAIYKLELWKIIRLDICWEAFSWKWYKSWTFSVNKDGTYNYECD